MKQQKVITPKMRIRKNLCRVYTYRFDYQVPNGKIV